MQAISSKTATSYIGSSSFKMALLFTILLGLSTVILGRVILSFNEQMFIHETEAVLDAEIDSIVAWQGYAGHSISDVINFRSLRADNQYYLYFDSHQTKLAGNLERLPVKVSRLTEGVIRFQIQGVAVAAKIHTFEDGRRLLVARDISMFLQEYDTFRLLSSLVIIFMFVVIFVSFAISGFVVSRINRIAGTAQDIIDTGDLSQRLSIDSNWDDLSNLALVLNRMLSRIEDLITGVRTISDNIAHDLRTPLTRLRNNLEKLDGTKSKPLVKEADHLLSIFSALLRISNIETGKRHAVFEQVALEVLLKDVLELYAPLIEERQIRLDARIASSHIQGDRDLLFQVFANLLDNAVKFTPRGGLIDVELTENGEILIADTGPGIPEEERAKVFDRFYRGEKSRTTQGTGLGLSLVAAVVTLHEGEIILEDNTPGVLVRLRFWIK